MQLSRVLTLSSLAILITVSLVQAQPQPRMIFGNSVETLRRFPHHVLIENYLSNPDSYAEKRHCGGSILNKHWILTSASCVQNIDVLQLSFQRLYLNNVNGSYSAVVNSAAVYEYPTLFDDIALIRIPFTLDFSETVQPVSVYSGSNIASGQFVVMPGFENSTTSEYGTPSPWEPQRENKLVYGMFGIVDGQSCRTTVGTDFDEYLQYCTKAWRNARNSPSAVDVGSGLLIGWPAKPQLIGIYTSNSWRNGVDVFTNVAKYGAWINDVIQNGIESN